MKTDLDTWGYERVVYEIVNEVYCWAWINLDLGSIENKEFYSIYGYEAYQLIEIGLLEPSNGALILNLKGSLVSGLSIEYIFQISSTGLGPLLTTLNYFLMVPELVGKHPNL